MPSAARVALVVCLTVPVTTAAEDEAGPRAALAERGLTFAITLQADHSANLRGGIRRGTSLRRPLALALDVDAERLVGWRGARLHGGLQSHGGGHGTNDLVGDIQGFDNVDAEGFKQLSELWLEQALLGGKVRLKLGKVDANSEFAAVEAGGGFLGSSAGFSPTIQGFPTYPDPAASMNVFVSPTDSFFVGAGVYDGSTHDGCHGRTGNRGPSTFWGAPSSTFRVLEAGVRFKVGGRSGRLSAGAWHHTGTFERTGAAGHKGTSGSYAVLEQRVVGGLDAGQGLDLFAQWGRADARVAEIDRHLSLGAAWTGALPGRGGDVLGLMVSSVRLPGADGRHETAIELNYGARLTPRLTLTPDLQYIVNPGGRRRGHALVATVRAALAL